MGKTDLNTRLLVDLAANVLEKGGSIFVQKSGSVVVELRITPAIAQAAVTKAATSKISQVLQQRKGS
jgi:hypothetical protein